MIAPVRTLRPNLSHWGAFEAEIEGDSLVAVHPFPADPHPTPLLDNIASSVRHPSRIAEPMVRAGWLDHGPGPSERRGNDAFVPVSWDRLTELLAGELRRVYGEHGPTAVYGGSYGWASAGRFHHAQSQIHRFLNLLGGYTASVDSYSYAAGGVILPRVIAPVSEFTDTGTFWGTLAEQTDIFLCFGGIPLKNAAVSNGGVFRHRTRDFLRAAVERGAEFVLFSPQRDDLAEVADATWHPLVPNSDVPVMLALAHTLITENLHDRAFLERYCVGYERFERYVLGLDDGQAKTPEWAESLSEIPAGEIAALARRLAGRRVFITTTWSLQRTEFGEQAPWMGVVLAALLGQIGLPGGGYAFGYGCTQRTGEAVNLVGMPVMPQGKNPTGSFIPVARCADMLLNPGAPFDYNGKRYSYPEIKLIYWAGGNPFHHHQHLGKLRRALATVDTIVVHDPFWTGMARHADIVVPATVTLERNDLGGGNNDAYLIAMQQGIPPYANARNDYDSFSDLASALDVGDAFTEGRDEMSWLCHLYDGWKARAAGRGYHFPDFDAFWEEGHVELPMDESRVLFADFRADPDSAPLRTPSGKIEIFSETIAGYGYPDCPGHPTWLEPSEWPGSARAERFPLLLIANNPRTRLHSQLDPGAHSQSSKVQGREPIRLHPADAAARGIADGDVVRVFNDRGSCLAGVVISDALRPGVAQLSTGAWYDPFDPADTDAMCVHGNPNAVTLDAGSSRLAQGSVGQHVLVEIERWDGPLPPIRAYEPPVAERRR